MKPLYLPKAAFFSTSSRFLFLQNGVQWITDSYVVARADRVRSLRGVEDRGDTFHLPMLTGLAVGPQLVWRHDTHDPTTGKPEAVRLACAHCYVSHDHGMYQAWKAAGLHPFLALADGGTGPVVAWRDIDDQLVGITALRRVHGADQ